VVRKVPRPAYGIQLGGSALRHVVTVVWYDGGLGASVGIRLEDDDGQVMGLMAGDEVTAPELVRAAEDFDRNRYPTLF
jgi:hypothetical protein